MFFYFVSLSTFVQAIQNIMPNDWAVDQHCFVFCVFLFKIQKIVNCFLQCIVNESNLFIADCLRYRWKYFTIVSCFEKKKIFQTFFFLLFIFAFFLISNKNRQLNNYNLFGSLISEKLLS